MRQSNINTLKSKCLSILVLIFILLLHLMVIGLRFTKSVKIGKSENTKFIMQGFQSLSESTKKKKKNVSKPNKKNIIKKQKVKAKKESAKKKAESKNFIKEESSQDNNSVADISNKEKEASKSLVGNTNIDFSSIILQKIEEKKIYPKAAQKRGQEGNIKLSLKISKSGELISVKIEKPCRHKFLNQAAIASVKAASPFPFEETAPKIIKLTFSIKYTLDNN